MVDTVARFLGLEVPYLREARGLWSAVTVGLPLFTGGMLPLGFALRVFLGRRRAFSKWPALLPAVAGGVGLALALAGWLVVSAAPFAFIEVFGLVAGALSFLVGSWLAGIRWTGTRL